MLINPLNAELNPICHLLALLGARHTFHVSGLRVNTHTFPACKERHKIQTAHSVPSNTQISQGTRYRQHTQCLATHRYHKAQDTDSTISA